ncbi:MAG TPA: HAD family hydrolase [Deinococcales bacterium]|nr:HAD family hydrolase [Deinococcales bacterium]
MYTGAVIRGIVFDVGATLIWGNGHQFERAKAWRAALLLREHGLVRDAPAFADRLVSLRKRSPKEGADYRQTGTTRSHLEQVLGDFGVAADEALLDWLELEYTGVEAAGARAIPGMPQLVRSLAGRVKLGVASNTRSHALTQQIIARLGLETLIDPLVTSVSAGYRKPSPHVFRAVLDSWDVEPGEVVMVGDSRRKDVAGAQATGMKGVWFRAEVLTAGGSQQEWLPEPVTPAAVADDAASLLRVLHELGLAH